MGRWTDEQIKLEILGEFTLIWRVFSQYSYLSLPICPSAGEVLEMLPLDKYLMNCYKCIRGGM